MDHRLSEKEIKQFIDTNYNDNAVKVDLTDMVGSMSSAYDIHKYYKDPIYTFNGLHGNYFVGDFGQMHFIDKQQKYTYRKDSKFQAFVMFFKSEAEHQLEVRVDLELQIGFFNTSHPECYRAFDELKKYAQNQLIYGRYDDNNSDLYNAEQILEDCQELIISVPFQKNNYHAQELLFIKSLFSEDMFEELPQPEYLQQYIGKLNKPIIFGKDLDPFQTTDEFLSIGQECQPGSLKCLLDQQPRQDSFYIYKGTQTNPPCKPIIWIIYKMPYYISGYQLQIVRDNMKMFQQNKQNFREKQNGVSWSDVEQFKILRMTDYREIECQSSKEKFEAYLNRLSYGKYGEQRYGLGYSSLYKQRSVVSKNKYIKTMKQQMKEELELFNRRDKTDDPKLSLRRYIRRMAYVNMNTAKKMLDWNQSDWITVDDTDSEKYEYGSDKQAVVMVNGQLQSQVYGYLSQSEQKNVDQVIEYANKQKQQSNIHVSNLQSVYSYNYKDGQAQLNNKKLLKK